MSTQNHGIEKKDDRAYFNVEVYGDYFTTSAQGNIVKPYGPIVLKMRRWESAQSIARFHILPKLIGEVDPEFKDMRKCIVLGVTTADNNEVYGLPIKLMSRKQIANLCRSQGIPLRTDMYPDIVQLRSKLQKALNNKEKFAKEEIKYQQSYEKIGDTLDLNANLFENLKHDQAQEVKLVNKKNSNNGRSDEILNNTEKDNDECGDDLSL